MGWGRRGGEFVPNSFRTIVSWLTRLFSDGCEDVNAEGTPFLRRFGEELATGRCAEARDLGVAGLHLVLNAGAAAAVWEALDFEWGVESRESRGGTVRAWAAMGPWAR
jgi:hypothetical protein